MNDILAVIPAYEPGDRFPGLVADLVATGLDVVVVDDGSGAEYASLFERAGAHERVTVLTHERNSGKGVALRTGLGHVLATRPAVTGVVTADADGQHLPEDVRRVADRLRLEGSGPDGARVCVLGERDFTLPSIPLRSRLGNRVTSGVVRLLAGRPLPDTQTGLRGVSRDLLPELLEVPGDRFEYEMQALLHLLGTRARVVGVPIETVYEHGRNDTSHFRPLQDSAIIYGTVLRQAGGFALSSGLGFLTDILVFVLVMDLGFGGRPTLLAVGVSTVVARLVSMAVNFGLNHAFVFRPGTSRRSSLVRYGVLAAGLLLASWLLTSALSHVLGHHVVWAKIAVDSTLFLVSYLVQRRWVFRRDRTRQPPVEDASLEA